MKLTEKCKENFEKWLISSLKADFCLGEFSYLFGKTQMVDWYKIPQSMQYGVYVDFFKSVGMIIDIYPLIDYDENVYTEILYWMTRVISLNEEIKEDDSDENEYKTRQEARVKAIEKANEIYNETQTKSNPRTNR